MGQSACHCNKAPDTQEHSISASPILDFSSTCLAEDEADEDPAWKEERVIYHGSMAGSLKDGDGILKLPDGAWYEGQFCRDKKTGHGVYHYPTGSSYCGQWRDDLQHGEGKESWSDGSTFQGQFAKGEKQGAGRFRWANGCSYEGQFDQNDMHGIGEYIFVDGRGYCGEWVRNDMGPSGRMWWPDGRVYEGEFLDGRKHGRGRLTWPDNRSYDGQWVEGRQHGRALARTSTGETRNSIWENGQFLHWVNEPSAPGGGCCAADLERQGEMAKMPFQGAAKTIARSNEDLKDLQLHSHKRASKVVTSLGIPSLAAELALELVSELAEDSQKAKGTTVTSEVGLALQPSVPTMENVAVELAAKEATAESVCKAAAEYIASLEKAAVAETETAIDRGAMIDVESCVSSADSLSSTGHGDPAGKRCHPEPPIVCDDSQEVPVVRNDASGQAQSCRAQDRSNQRDSESAQAEEHETRRPLPEQNARSLSSEADRAAGAGLEAAL